MTEKNQENPNITTSIELSRKFEFYFIALVFTILGLSVQTASIVREYYQYVFEILAWVSLLVSGLAGLSRLEWLPVAYQHYGCSEIEKNNLNVISQGLEGRTVINEKGQAWPGANLNNAKQELENQIKKRDKEISEIEKRTTMKYQIHKWAFVVGIISLVVSRSILHLMKIF
jgi:hypothetical protein